MAQADIIREFLVSLGFKTDDKSLKKFTDGVEGATARVAGLVTAIAGSATVLAFYKFAQGMEALYFSTQKAGASAINMKAFEKAAQNFGAASGDALASVQSLARWMRETPASEGFLKSLGVDARDANGKLKDTTQLMVELGDALRNKPYAVARQYGNLLGIGEDTLRAMMNGDFARELEKQRGLLKDAGYDEATKKAHEFQVRLRELQTQLEVIGVKFGLQALDLIDKYQPAIKGTTDLVIKMIDWIGKGAKALMDFGFRATSGGIMLERLLTGDTKGARKAAKAMVEGMDASTPQSPKPDSSAPVSSASTGGPVGMGWAKEQAAGIKQSLISGEATADLPKSKTDPMKFFMGMGWTKEQAAGIVANLRAESGMNPGAVGDNGQAYGIAQWHPDRQAAFEKWSGKSIKDSTLYEQLSFVNHELTQGAEKRAGDLLRAARNSAQAGEIVSRNYERPKAADIEAAKRGAAAVQIAQNTTINVTGNDPIATGRAVANEQDRVTMTMKRNFQSAVN